MLKDILGCYFRCAIEGYFLYAADPSNISVEPGAPLPSEYQLRSFGSADLHQLCNIWKEAYFPNENIDLGILSKKVSVLLESDDIGVGLFFGEELVGMQWAGFSDFVERTDFARYLKDEAETAIFHHSYISPAHRGKKLQLPMMWFTECAVRDRGAKTLYTFVGVNNFASVKNMMRAYERYQTVYHVKIDLPGIIMNIFPCSSLADWKGCELD